MVDRLWAPWRFRYVTQAPTADSSEGDSNPGCIFVDLPASQEDRKNLILLRGKHAFVMLNGFPYTSGHLMVAPYKHTANLADLTDEEHLEIQQLITRAIGWLDEAYHPEGYNVGLNLGAAGGAGIPSHLHWHIVPRWRGDTNFMTTVGETRVLPQGLEDAYDLLFGIAQR